MHTFQTQINVSQYDIIVKIHSSLSKVCLQSADGQFSVNVRLFSSFIIFNTFEYYINCVRVDFFVTPPYIGLTLEIKIIPSLILFLGGFLEKKVHMTSFHFTIAGIILLSTLSGMLPLIYTTLDLQRRTQAYTTLILR